MRQNDLKRLREHRYELRALPDTLTQPGVTLHATPIAEATLDDLAITIMDLDAEVNALTERLRALRRLYELAREGGARGRDLALKAAARGLK
ncbi:hypothetical protein LV82_00659 [Albidovulum inexpectatum]|uniref:Uncharacterized protein n=1 Tax=Albidovulum inexpectatum TaxID=196587 RepID=A0A2S5JMK2_9RHOB|nr:hypothetical protein [Albidovulum inexpectatum]PPB82719.1 hypothetical protein LV82_00659 [Albidovulum inexpectatum]